MKGPSRIIIEQLAALTIPQDAIRFRTTHDLSRYAESLRDVETFQIASSRRGQPMAGWRFGRGVRTVSVIAGCHADEPMGPMTAQALPRLLESYFPELLARFRFVVIPQMNPDGADANRPWFSNPPDLTTYMSHVVREQPGDDVEFGFGGVSPRPEAQGAMQFLRDNGPCEAHFSLHGMGFGEGAWFLICREWIARTPWLRNALLALCAGQALGMHDVDRGGEKGFVRIEEGFCTTPLSTAMREHFMALNEPDVAARFQPTSMEFVQSLGGDPFCGVTEMPLFLVGMPREDLVDTPTQCLRRDLQDNRGNTTTLHDLSARYRITPMPLPMQMRMQLAFIVLALTCLE